MTLTPDTLFPGLHAPHVQGRATFRCCQDDIAAGSLSVVDPVSPRNAPAAISADRDALALRFAAQSRVLAELALNPLLPRGKYDLFCELIIERARSTLRASVVGIWHYSEPDGVLSARRILTEEGNSLTGVKAQIQLNSPRYFSLLGAGDAIDASDALRDPRTRELADNYLLPRGVQSLLDAPLLIDGRLVGILRIEQIGRQRTWLPDEIAFARALAHQAAESRLLRRRLRDRAALRCTEERLDAAQVAASVGSFEWNPETGAMWWSAHLHWMLGVAHGSFNPTRASFLALVHADDRDEVDRAIHGQPEQSGGAPLLVRMVRTDAEVRWVQFSWRTSPARPGARGKVTGNVFDVTERQQQSERIHTLAFHDSLTGLPNRRFVIEQITVAIAAAQSNGPFAVVCLGIDNFRTVNDSLGHGRGDELLREVAQRLVRVLDPQASVGRLGGDQFILRLPGVGDARAARLVADRVLAEMRRPFEWRDLGVSVTASLGIACYPEDGDDAETLVRNADAAMYEAKDAGRDEIRTFAPTLNHSALRRLSLESGLRAALRRNEFKLFLQPCFGVERGELRSCEALLRWEDPTHGLVLPNEFLPVAEQSGLILEIGDWVLSEACRIQSRWQTLGLPAVPISINLSGRQVLRHDVALWFERTLSAYGLDTRWFQAEMTETRLMQAVGQALPSLRRLGEIGVRLAVDDFGSGYSSLAHLRRLPLSILKVDRSFICDVTKQDGEAAVIASAVIGIARKLKLEVIAEGVETQAQLDWLTSEGCDGYQGYLRSPAIAPAAFERRFLGRL